MAHLRELNLKIIIISWGKNELYRFDFEFIKNGIEITMFYKKLIIEI